ncbi:hypothetical protein HYE82_02890 [Streptomyces sp. BR123]|uniref:hypothetical protein n=1 Tax=Streptomyces sp. BR123 TaxID=2749828 RepID=UPI0015C4DEEF|nr:hypothetical protein [Streptomyces sp. BR123]NXY93374.1 hypothetical protein [Streptomyces sp. BR123]
MAEHLMTLHCEPCPSCRHEARQLIVDGRLRWEEQEHCSAYGVQACGSGWGPPPPWVRERITAVEGTVRVAVGGPDGAPLKAVREVFGLTLRELAEARHHGLDATPVEAELLRTMAARG